MCLKALHRIKLILPALILFSLFACRDAADQTPSLSTDRQAVKGDSTVNQQLDSLLTDYFSLTGAFAYGIPAEIEEKAEIFGRSLRQLKLDRFAGDSLLYEAIWVEKENCLAENEAIIADPELTEKRMSLHLLSGELYNLLRAVKYTKTGLSLLEKPDVFGEGKPGQWLTADPSAPGPFPGRQKPLVRENW